MSSYARVGEFFGHQDLNESTQTEATSMNTSNLGVQDMFGDDVRTKGKPVKGYRFLIFTFIMIIALTTIVALSVEDIKKEELDLINDARHTKTTDTTEPAKTPTGDTTPKTDDGQKTEAGDTKTDGTKTDGTKTDSSMTPSGDATKTDGQAATGDQTATGGQTEQPASGTTTTDTQTKTEQPASGDATKTDTTTGGDTSSTTDSTKPAEGATQTDPSQPSTDTKPAETQPVETKPDETQPVETKPEESQPVAPSLLVIPGESRISDLGNLHW